MKLMTSLQTTLIFIIIGMTFSCRPEVKDDRTDLILGRWDIEEANRNGRPTESLAELYFEFYEDGTMLSNLAGNSEKAKYKIEKEQLLQRDSRIEADYTIEEMTDSTLILSTRLRDIPFRFLLTKSIQEK